MESDRPFNRIVVPLDGSDLARSALLPAAELARRASVPLTLYTDLGGHLHRGDIEAELLAGVERLADEVVVDTRIGRAPDGTARAIIDEAGDGALVCMSSHGHSGFGRMLLGSVTEQVLTEIRPPVLVVGPRFEAERAVTSGNLLACLDGSRHAEAVLPAATTWAYALDLPLWLASVVDPGTAAELRASARRGDIAESGYLARVAAGLPLRADYEVLHSRSPASEVARFAVELPASIVAVATHGRTGWRRVALGSVAMSIVHRAPCPVLITSVHE